MMYKFSDIVEINPKESIPKGKISKKIAMQDLLENSREIKGYVEEEYKSGSKFRRGDTLFSRITPCLENGKIAQVNILEEGEIAFGSTEFLVFRAKKDLTLPDYVYHLSKWSFVRESAIKSMTGTSGRQRVQNAIFDEITLNLPSIKKQQIIVDTLNAFDQKIEVNNKIIANLEEQAQAIFKSWFIDFEPFQDGEFVESELGLIPKGWEIYKLGNFFPIITGKKNANIASENGVYPFFTCSQNILYADDFSFDANAILLAGNGDFNVKRYNGKFEAYQRTYVLIPENENYVGLLYNLIKYYLPQIVSGYKGSVINYITKGMIEDFKVALPEKIDTSDILKIFNMFEEKILKSKDENSSLAQTRDALLPKLMSGEIDVSNIEIDTGEESHV
jgi:type I restriction enzyme S subunit